MSEFVCGKCGYKNGLGVVFCGSCGQKLDLSAVSSAASQAPSYRGVAQGFFKLAAALLMLALLGGITAALWPAGSGAPPATPDGLRTVEAKLQHLRAAARAGVPATAAFSSAELNAYLMPLARARGVDQLTVDLRPTAFVVRALQPYVPALSGTPFQLSVEVVGDFRRGDRVIVRRVRLGHLRLPRPLDRAVARRLAPAFSGIRSDRVLMQGIRTVKLGADQIEVTVGR